MTIYRIEHKDRKSGMWYSEKAEHIDYFNTKIPMDKDAIFRTNNKEWFCGVVSIEDLREWFSKDFIKKMLDENYAIHKIEKSDNEYQILPTQVVFTKTGIDSIVELKLSDIYTD